MTPERSRSQLLGSAVDYCYGATVSSTFKYKTFMTFVDYKHSCTIDMNKSATPALFRFIIYAIKVHQKPLLCLPGGLLPRQHGHQ